MHFSRAWPGLAFQGFLVFSVVERFGVLGFPAFKAFPASRLGSGGSEAQGFRSRSSLTREVAEVGQVLNELKGCGV